MSVDVFPAWDGPHCFELFDPVNAAPIISNCPAPLTFTHCQYKAMFDFDATDIEGDPYTFELVSGPGSIDATTGVWEYVPLPSDVGLSIQLEVRAVDSRPGPICTVDLNIIDSPDGNCSYNTSLSLDHVDGLDGGMLLTDVPVTFYIRWTNNSGYAIDGASNGFRVYSPDGATWDPVTHVPYTDPDPPYSYQVFYTGWDTMFDLLIHGASYGNTGSGADTVGFAQARSFGTGAPVGFNDVVHTISTIIDADQVGKTICLDSAWYPPSNLWIWVPNDIGYPDGIEINPAWDGPHCFEIKSAAGRTEVGTGVVVEPEPGMTITFDEVNESGWTEVSTGSEGSPPPQGYELPRATLHSITRLQRQLNTTA